MLVIDDDPEVRAYLEDVLRIEGFVVTSLSDPRSVVDRLLDEPFDIAVVDVCMPELDGIELLARIRAVDDAIPVIMVNAYLSLEILEASHELGVSACLAHPITPDELRDAIAGIVTELGHAARSRPWSIPR